MNQTGPKFSNSIVFILTLNKMVPLEKVPHLIIWVPKKSTL